MSNNSSADSPWMDESIQPFLKIQNLSKSFENAKALDSISLEIYRKEFFALLGPSGCGKSTLLRILAGFEAPDEGAVTLENESIVEIPVYKRPINMMFQSYALFPHMTVEQNIAFGLKQEKLDKSEIKERTDKAIELVQLNQFARRKPNQLSGGQQQRAALARSLVKGPKLLLLDEPLGALDKKLRQETQFELVDLQEKLEMTFIIVTHDQEEAMTVASRIAVMDHGKVVQVGTPLEMYEFPQTRFVAHFIGDVNIFDSEVTSVEDGCCFVACADIGKTLEVQQGQPESAFHTGDKVGFAIRPEKISIHKSNGENKDSNSSVEGTVYDIGYLGGCSVYHVQLATGKMMVASVNNNLRQEFMPITWNDKVILSWNVTSGLLLKS